MRTWLMPVLAVTVGLLPARAQQADTLEARRRALEDRMRELQAQVRELERELARLKPLSPRGGEVRTEVRVRGPVVQFLGQRAYLGVTVNTEKNPATDSIGAVLQAVTPGGPAERAGLQAGDIITTFNGERLAGRYPAAGEYESEPGIKLVDFARKLEDGDTVVVDYRRGHESRRATIVARPLGPESFGFVLTTPPPRIGFEPEELAERIRAAVTLLGERWLDLELVALNPELGEYFGTSEGLLVIRAPKDSSLRLKGGDVILAVDGRKPGSQAQLMRILRSYSEGEEIKLEIMRQKRRLTLTVKVPERFSRGEEFEGAWRSEWP